MDAPYRFPRVLVCGSDSLNDPDATELPFWAQVTTAISRTYIQQLQIDIAVDLAPERDAASIQKALGEVSEHIDVNDLGTSSSPLPLPLEPHHSHLFLYGVTPTSIIPQELTTVYTPSPSAPLTHTFPFDRLGPNAFLVLEEAEAHDLLIDFRNASGETPFEGGFRLTGRPLVRALVANAPLGALRGVVIMKGEKALKGCVASAKVVAPVSFDELDDDDDDEDEDYEDREERYEYEIAPAIIEGGPVDTTGTVAAFIGKFVSSLVQGWASIPQIRVYNESGFSFQLEQACIAAATTALSSSSAPFTTRIPTLGDALGANISQYLFNLPMLKPGERGPSREEMARLSRSMRGRAQPNSWKADVQ